MRELIWKKFNGEIIKDVSEYILNYVSKVDKGSKVIIGCDSDNNKRKTVYAITVILYNEDLRKGAHVIYARERVPKIRDVSQKLWKEAEYLYNVAESVNNALKGTYYKKFEKNHYDGSIPTKLVEIHVDLNPKRNTRNGRKISNNLSNKVYNEIMGWLCGSGFKVNSKPYSYASSSTADKLCR